MASCPAYGKELLGQFPFPPVLLALAVDARARPAALGSGMAFVRQLLLPHADRIDMHSKPGDGSRFYRNATEIEEHT